MGSSTGHLLDIPDGNNSVSVESVVVCLLGAKYPGRYVAAFANIPVIKPLWS
jgi:hypothetical protein